MLKPLKDECRKRKLATYGTIEMLEERLRNDDGTGKKSPGRKPAYKCQNDPDKDLYHVLMLPTKLDAATMKKDGYEFVREDIGSQMPYIYRKKKSQAELKLLNKAFGFEPG